MSDIDLARKQNIQGNILKGFNKDNSRLIFFNILDVDEASEWFNQLVDQKRIPSTQDLLEAAERLNERWKKEPNFKPRETWVHVAFSAKGIKKFGLELPPSTGAYGFDPPAQGHNDLQIVLKNPSAADPNDPFKVGMKPRAGTLGDTNEDDPTNWIEPFKSKDEGLSTATQPSSGEGIDGVLRVDSDQPEDADQAAIELIVEFTQRGISCLGLQKGTAVFNPHGKQVEHFGFRDGVSQPLIRGIDDDEIMSRHVEPDDHDFKKFVLFGLSGNREWANDGSFMVFRRLSQDFPGFWEFMNNNCQQFGLTAEGLAAKFVGRWTSGAPLAKFPNSDPNIPSAFDENDFKYMQDDSRGNNTPRFAHIRKVYPRDDGIFGNVITDDQQNDTHRIIRRGIPFGSLFANDPQGERGLLFMCYQIDLANQFEFIQRTWANNPNFPKADNQTGQNHGQDPIIGKHHGNGFVNLFKDDGTATGQFKRIDKNTAPGFKQWVTTTAGGYFFSPSMSALKNLKV